MESTEFLSPKSSKIIPFPQTVVWRVRHLPLKRSFDILFSFAALTLGLPVFLLIALVTRLTSKGPVIYSHQRVGRGGKLFSCYKFRTMYANADAMLEEVLDSDPQLREDWEERRKLANDPRVTPMGRFLRKTSLDELPQFFNVLVGDMSVVGPRPVCTDEVKQFFGMKAYKILQVRPGVTGLWQTAGRSVSTYEERVSLDENYVDTHSFFVDLLLVLKTIPRMVWPRGAW